MLHTEASYRKYWATLTGKSEREIYVPAALRTPSPAEQRAEAARKIAEEWS